MPESLIDVLLQLMPDVTRPTVNVLIVYDFRK